MKLKSIFTLVCTLLTILLVRESFRPTLGLAAGPNPAGMIEPEASQWQTWTLKASDELRPAAPPDQAATQKELAEVQALVPQRDAQALEQITYWDTGSPNYRWVQLALEPYLDGPPNAMVGRTMALLNVALYDAMIAAWDAKYAYNRPHPSEVDPTLATVLPNPASPSYPSEQAVAAGAASTILGYLFPDNAKRYNELAETAAQSRVLAGVSFPSDIKAGLDLGRAVAEKVIARAKSDDSDAPWTGSVPTGPGKWVGKDPAGPTVGSWQTWVLHSGDQLRLPPPPAYDSEQKQAEIAEIQAVDHSFPITQKALYWHTFYTAYPLWYDWAGQHIFETKLDQNPPRAARVYALLSVASYDAIVACFDTKYTYWAARPDMLDPSIKTLFPDPPHPSYPSAHACNTGSSAAVLAYLFPNEAKTVEALADEAAMSRMWAGIHFRSDDEAGLLLGREVASLVIQRAQHDGAQATQSFPVGKSIGRELPGGEYLVITFKDNGKMDFHLTAGETSEEYLDGATYQVQDNQLILGGDPETCGGSGEAEGAYQWAFDGAIFSFNATADKCDMRRTVNMSGPWFVQQ